MKKSIAVIILLLPVFTGYSQQKVQDSLQANPLQEIVVTGQIEPQSLRKSVFNVRVISSQDIKNLAANNLADVLNQYLNITVRPSSSDGRSTVSLFGLDGQYFKILVDNIPLIGEAGLGNNADLSQINLDDIEQIEIIEGSMGVTHGANAVSGVLNIITKKGSRYKWSLRATTQEESVHNEFSLFDKGRYIQALALSYVANERWFFNASVNRNDFQGFLDGKKGKDYFENDATRGYRWLPKEQWNATTMLGYQKNAFRMFYKFQWLNERVDFYNSTVQSGYSPTLGSYRYAMDKRYWTQRFFHNWNASGKLENGMSYTVSLSHQKQQRDTEDFRYYLFTQQEKEAVRQKDQAMEVLYSTGTLSNFFKSKKIDVQLGYEVVSNLGYSLVQEGNNLFVPIAKRLNNYDWFMSSEIKATPSFSIRPGVRYSIQSQFDNQYATSLGLRYLLPKGIELRTSLGQSFRTPTFEELYTKQIFDGHHFTGNENLIPETSWSYEMSAKKTSFLDSGLQVAHTFTANYLKVDDRIDMALARFNAETGNPEYEYINISRYQMWNVATTNQFKGKNWLFNLGASLVGVSQKIDNQVFVSDDRFLYTINANTSVSYTVPKWKTIVSAYYKYSGKTQQFIESSAAYVISEIDDSHWLDATIQKNFFSNTLETTIGARNLFDIKNINQTRTAEGAGHATSNQVMLAYGRSFFVKLTYNLNL